MPKATDLAALALAGRILIYAATAAPQLGGGLELPAGVFNGDTYPDYLTTSIPRIASMRPKTSEINSSLALL